MRELFGLDAFTGWDVMHVAAAVLAVFWMGVALYLLGERGQK